ncbi:hypothetical protein KAU55_03190 [Candidatus Bathyarchaeota archaeon]|nr:hypothetical protein [Candidatus Bathyarchaeota archaeon]
MSKKSDPLLSKLDTLAEKLDVLTTVTAAGAFQGKQLTESIAILLGLGLEPSKIARILGTKPNIVRAIKSQLTKKNKEKKPQSKLSSQKKEVK